MLGWAPNSAEADDFFDNLDAMADAFDLRNLNKAAAVVNMDKLHYFNKRHIHAAKPGSSNFDTVLAMLEARGATLAMPQQQLATVVATLQDSYDDIDSLAMGIQRIMTRPTERVVVTEAVEAVLKAVQADLPSLGAFQAASIHQLVKAQCQQAG